MSIMVDFSNFSTEELLTPGGFDCDCGHHHEAPVKFLKIGPGVVKTLPEALKTLGCKKPYIVCDLNTKEAAWDKVEPVLKEAGIEYSRFYFSRRYSLEPNEEVMGAITFGFDKSCDVVLAIGSGVINDACKIISSIANIPCMVVGTAPSMDGYASNSSSMIRERIKVSLYNAAPAAIICDIDIIKNAPMRMLWAGFGDMLAKYIAICERRIPNLVTGEYYCENIANLMRASLKKIVDNAPGLKTRDEKAVQATVEGLVLSGVAMSYAGISRPASGLEHYFSHLWEMMALDRGTDYELHGIQVGVGTLITLKLYDDIRNIKPSREVAEKFISEFTNEEWEKMIRNIFGQAAETVIKQEYAIFHKNDKARHAARLTKILEGWDDILRFIDEELPATEKIAALMKDLGMPMVPADIDINEEDTVNAFIGSRDIRDKYLSSTMLWDLGLLYTTKLPE